MSTRLLSLWGAIWGNCEQQILIHITQTCVGPLERVQHGKRFQPIFHTGIMSCGCTEKAHGKTDAANLSSYRSHSKKRSFTLDMALLTGEKPRAGSEQGPCRASARSCQRWDGCCSHTGLASGFVNIAQALGRWGEKGNHCSGHLNAPEPFISRHGSCPYA